MVPDTQVCDSAEILEIRVSGRRDFYERMRNGSGGVRPLSVSPMAPKLSRAKRVDFSSAILQIHNILRNLDGLHADEALDEFCKLIFLKIISECEEDYSDLFDFDKKTSFYVASTLRRTPDHLRRAESFRGVSASSPIFEASRLSIAALDQVSRILSSVQLSDYKDVSGEVFQAIISPATRQGMGQYFTPSNLAVLAASAVSPKPGEIVVDPFCGSGQFLVASRNECRRKFGSDDVTVRGIEKSPKMVRVATTDFLLAGLPLGSVTFGDSITPSGNELTGLKASVDCVVTNPPFGSLVDFGFSFESDLTLRSGQKTPLEIAGLERSVSMLRVGGRIAIVIPDSVLDGRRTSFVRDWINAKLDLVAIIGLPDTTFEELGALHKTSLLIGQKRGAEDTDRRVLLADLADSSLKSIAEMTSTISTFIEREPFS